MKQFELVSKNRFSLMKKIVPGLHINSSSRNISDASYFMSISFNYSVGERLWLQVEPTKTTEANFIHEKDSLELCSYVY